MKIVHISLCIIFLLFAFVQYNDSDPYLWIPIYLFVAGVCGYAAMGKYDRNITLGGLLLLSLYAISYLPDVVDWIQMGMPSIVETMKAEKMYVELTREFGGLLVCCITLGWYVWRGARR